MSQPMPAEPKAARLSLLYAVVFVEIGIAMPFMPVWLKALGLDARIIGALLALPIAMKIIATTPLVGLIDRGVAARRLLLVGSLVVAATYALMPAGAAVGWPILALLVAVNAAAGAPLVPTIDYLTLAAVRHSKRLDYARIRMAGSVGFLIASLLGGAALSGMGERIAVPVLLTGLALVAATTIFASPVEAHVPRSPMKSGERPRLPRVLWLCIGAQATIQASHAATYAFGSIHWQANGISSSWIGLLWATGVAAEIVFFATVSRWPTHWRTPFRLIGLGAVASLVRVIGLSQFGGDLVPALFLQLLHAFSFGATQLGAMTAISAFAPDGARGRAQGMSSAVNAFASASATILCGVAYQAGGGSLAFALMAPLALSGLCLVTLSARVAARVPFTRPRL